MHMLLTFHGVPGLLNGLPDDASDELIAGRLREMGPSIASTPEEVKECFAARARIGASLDGIFRDAVLEPVLSAAFDSESPKYLSALKALSPYEPSAAAQLKRIEQARHDALPVLNVHEKIRSCMGDH